MNNIVPSNFDQCDPALVAIFKKIKNGEENFEFEDLLTVLRILKNDRILNDFFVRENEGTDEIGVIDGYTDLGDEIAAIYPQYSYQNLEAIQAMIQNTCVLPHAIATDVWKEDGKIPESYCVSMEHLIQLKAEDIDVQIEFNTYSNYVEEGLYVKVNYIFENFVLET